MRNISDLLIILFAIYHGFLKWRLLFFNDYDRGSICAVVGIYGIFNCFWHKYLFFIYMLRDCVIASFNKVYAYYTWRTISLLPLPIVKITFLKTVFALLPNLTHDPQCIHGCVWNVYLLKIQIKMVKTL